MLHCSCRIKKKTWYTNKANFETFCKNRITDFLPGNFIESNYYNGQEEPEVQKKKPRNLNPPIVFYAVLITRLTDGMRMCGILRTVYVLSVNVTGRCKHHELYR